MCLPLRMLVLISRLFMKDRYLPGAHVDALEYVHLIRAGAFFRGVADNVDDNVVVHFLQESMFYFFGDPMRAL